MTSPLKLSYSLLKKYDTCPKQLYHVRVARDFKEPDSTEATLYGEEFHTAAENYVKSRAATALPAKFKFAKSYLDQLLAIDGEHFCELKMGLTDTQEACQFNADNVWFRAIADLVVVNHDKGKAWVLDYKTGKSSKYADLGQLQLMALCIFKHFPHVTKVKAGLLFVVADVFKPAEYKVSESHLYWRPWQALVHRLRVSESSGVWNPKPNGLCRKHCVVTSCPHNGAAER